jgi:predicted nucleotidyltransferase
MRLPNNSISVIKSAIQDNFPGQVETFLFGSRVDDNKRGGDIDLLIIDNLPQSQLEMAKIRALTTIHVKLGEQKIDMVVTANPQKDRRPVVQMALAQGVLL